MYVCPCRQVWYILACMLNGITILMCLQLCVFTFQGFRCQEDKFLFPHSTQVHSNIPNTLIGIKNTLSRPLNLVPFCSVAAVFVCVCTFLCVCFLVTDKEKSHGTEVNRILCVYTAIHLCLYVSVCKDVCVFVCVCASLLVCVFDHRSVDQVHTNGVTVGCMMSLWLELCLLHVRLESHGMHEL